MNGKDNIFFTLKDMKVPFVQELKFHPTRKWKFDYAITLQGKMIAVEYEGIFTDKSGNKKSRHTTLTGYTGDADKYNAATVLGWKVLRYTAMNYKNLREDLNQILR